MGLPGGGPKLRWASRHTRSGQVAAMRPRRRGADDTRLNSPSQPSRGAAHQSVSHALSREAAMRRTPRMHLGGALASGQRADGGHPGHRHGLGRPAVAVAQALTCTALTGRSLVMRRHARASLWLAVSHAAIPWRWALLDAFEQGAEWLCGRCGRWCEGWVAGQGAGLQLA